MGFPVDLDKYMGSVPQSEITFAQLINHMVANKYHIRRAICGIVPTARILSLVNIGSLRQRQARRCITSSMYTISLNPVVLRIDLHLRHHVIEFHVLLPYLATILHSLYPFLETI